MKQLLDMIEAVANEKAMPSVLVRQAMEKAISALVRKEQKAPDATFRAEIDPKTGEIRVFRVWTEVSADESIENPETQRHEGPFEEPAPEPTWTRQGLQVVKQVLYQNLRQLQRQQIAEDWADREGTVVRGLVRRVDRRRVLVDLGDPVEGVIPWRALIRGERFREGERISALVTGVDASGRGPVVQLSRTDPRLVRELVAIEVPEVERGLVIIHKVVRDPGSRAKVAVEAGPGLNGSAPAVCAGMRGVRAQSVSAEINGERLDYITWSENPVEFILAALAPAEVTDMVLDEDEHRVWVGVEKEKLARAIGRKGQNIRLAAELTGWMIEMMSSEELKEQRAREEEATRSALRTSLDADEEMIDILLEEGFRTIEDLVLAHPAELMAIDGFDEELAKVVKDRAKQALDLQTIESEMENANPDSLHQLTGMTDTDLRRFEEQGIQTLHDLAEQATFDVEWPSRERDRLSAWIMEARTKIGMFDEEVEADEVAEKAAT